MNENEVVVEYKGHLLIQRVHSLNGTSRILGSDGSWRCSEPTVIGGEQIDWVIRRRSADGAVEDVAVVASYKEAKCTVDDTSR